MGVETSILSSSLHKIIHKLMLTMPIMKIVEFANREDPDEMAHNEPSHLDLHCLPSNSLNSQFDRAWTKHFWGNFADINFVVCF